MSRSSNSSQVREALVEMAMELLQKRIEKLKARKFVLFPWLRIKWLMRKWKKAMDLLEG